MSFFKNLALFNLINSKNKGLTPDKAVALGYLLEQEEPIIKESIYDKKIDKIWKSVKKNNKYTDLEKVKIFSLKQDSNNTTNIKLKKEYLTKAINILNKKEKL